MDRERRVGTERPVTPTSGVPRHPDGSTNPPSPDPPVAPPTWRLQVGGRTPLGCGGWWTPALGRPANWPSRGRQTAASGRGLRVARSGRSRVGAAPTVRACLAA